MILESLTAFLTLWKPLVYAIFFAAMIIEGDIFLFTAAFLTQQGFFNPGYMISVIFGGVVIGDLLWYEIGGRLANSQSRTAKWTQRMAQPFDRHLQERPFRTILISKFTYGLHHAIIRQAGAIKLPPQKFVWSAVRASIIWIAVIGALGVAAGAGFEAIRSYLRYAELSLLVFVVIFFLVEKFIISRQLKKEL